MFNTARLKLTGWYLLIIMLISGAFSFVIYRALTYELDRLSRLQRFRVERRLFITPVPVIDPELVAEAKRRVIFTLGFINLGILAVSGATGYFLASQTLKPIQDMVDEQNRFISDASHELRTPLTALKSAMEVFLRGKYPKVAEAKVLISESLDDVNKLQSLSESLMQLAQFQKPIDRTRFELLSLSEILSESVKKISPIAAKKNITISTTGSDYRIKGDKYSLTDLFVILLDNAVKYSSKDTAINLTTKKSDNSVKISVIDQGIGITGADLPHIFDRFYRADTARSKTDSKGFGLGLSIAQKIVTTHSGSISVTSKPGSGSTFVVKLPLPTSKLLASFPSLGSREGIKG